MAVKYDNTRSTDEQVEEQGLSEMRDAYLNFLDLQNDYYTLQSVKDSLPTLHPLFMDASKRACEAKRAYAGAIVLADLLCAQLVARPAGKQGEEGEGKGG